MKDKIFYFLKYNNYYINRYIKYLDYVDELSFNKKQNILHDKLIGLVQYAIDNSKFYREYYYENGINKISSIDDFKDLPTVDKKIIKKNLDTVRVGLKKTKLKGYTSGTSGNPLELYRSIPSVLKEAGYLKRFLEKRGHKLTKDRTVSLRGNLGKNEIFRFDNINKVLYLSSYNLNHENISKYYNLIKSFHPNAILAYPSSLEVLLNLFIDNGYNISIPKVFTSSETLYLHQKEKIHDFLKSDIFDRYGNAERSICLEQNIQDEFYSEAILYSKNFYMKDKIITTSLINYDFPLIKYEVDDVIEINKNGKERIITNIKGREDDFLNLSDGSKVGRMDHIFKGLKNIKYGQIVQKSLDHFSVNIVPTQKFNNSDKEKIIQNVQAKVGENESFEVYQISEEEIIMQSSNKFKMVINRIESR